MKLISPSPVIHGRLWRRPLNSCEFSIVLDTRNFLQVRSKLSGSASSMPRPDYIARVHGANYDLRTCDPMQRPERLRLYKEALAEAARIAQCSERLLEAAIQPDYAAWVKEQSLPRIDRRK